MRTIIHRRPNTAAQPDPIRSYRAIGLRIPETASLVALLVLGGCATEPNPFDQPQSAAFALNNQGQIVGSSDADGGIRAVMWERGTIRNLGLLPTAEWSAAVAVNERGDVVGVSGKRACVETQPDNDHFASVFLWDGTTMNDVGGADPACLQVEALNDSGYVVFVDLASTPTFSLWHQGVRHDFEGAGFIALNNRGQILLRDLFDPDAAPVVWHDGSMQSVEGLGGRTRAVDINDAGTVVGMSTTPSGEEHAFLWDGIQTLDLGTLGGTYSAAAAINEAGQVVGSSLTASGDTCVFLWEAGTMTDLGPAPGATPLAADIVFQTFHIIGINERSQILLERQQAGGRVAHSRAYVWDAGTWLDLGTLGGTTVDAVAINDLGQVIGSAQTPDAWSRAFLWDNGTLVDLGTLVDGN